ncbi:MAG TPA: TolC family protein [Thermoanaerobaculia bacterium]|nr:TolC family protein [Thermoanaerobaculia bacterium]
MRPVVVTLVLLVFAPAFAAAQQPTPPNQAAQTPQPVTQQPASAMHPPNAQANQPATAVANAMSPQAAVQAALQQANSLQQAIIDEQIAAEDVTQARAALLPRIRNSDTFLYNSPAHPPTSGQSFIAQNDIREYQMLVGAAGDLNLGLFAAIRRAQALLRAAHAGTEIARRALVRSTNEAYYAAALATAKRAAAEQSLAAAQEFEHITQLNYNAGEVPEVDLIRARLQTAARRDDLASAREAEIIANAMLGTLIGYGISRTPGIAPLPQTIDPAEIGRLTQEGVARRPEFAQLEAQVQAAREEIAVGRADYWPKITYSVDEGFDSPSLNPDVLRQHRGVLATANVDWTLFDWGATHSRQRQAQLRLQSAQLQQRLAGRSLYLEFATARQEATNAAERVDNDRRALADAERNVTISIARYRAGEAPITEATDALTTRAQQRLALEQALYDFQVALGHLQEATAR